MMRPHRISCLAAFTLFGAMAPAQGVSVSELAPGGVRAGGPLTPNTEARIVPIAADLQDRERMTVHTTGQTRIERVDPSAGVGEPRGGSECIETISYSDLGQTEFFAQGGFVESEIMAASYVLDPSVFPIKIEAVKGLFATANAIQNTQTAWTVFVWEGTPATGTLVASFSSDNVILVDLFMPPGTNGTVIDVRVDPGDPEQIFINNTGGSNTFSIGFRIDEHNAPSPFPCLIPPASNNNAFPATDTEGVDQPNNNWLFAINCGFGIAGWNRFSDLGAFQPSGDWALEAEWSSVNCTPGVGACCLPDGSCDLMAVGDCIAMNGDYQGDGTSCGGVTCVPDAQACCFAATGGCIDLTPEQCMLANGVPGGLGTTCATFTCFPSGACCLPDGSCADGLTPEECMMMNGAFQGDGSTCATSSCPEFPGACCFGGDSCLELLESQCMVASGEFLGAGSDCAACAACEADLAPPMGVLDFNDVVAFLNAFAAMDPAADFALPMGVYDFNDVIAFLSAFGAGCP